LKPLRGPVPVTRREDLASRRVFASVIEFDLLR
jgi:hypothetical protein